MKDVDALIDVRLVSSSPVDGSLCEVVPEVPGVGSMLPTDSGTSSDPRSETVRALGVGFMARPEPLVRVRGGDVRLLVTKLRRNPRVFRFEVGCSVDNGPEAGSAETLNAAV